MSLFRIAVVDPEGSLEPLAAKLRALGAGVERVRAVALLRPPLALVIVNGDVRARREAHAFGGIESVPVVEIVPNDPRAEDEAFSRGADDVLVLGRESRLPAIVRRVRVKKPTSTVARAEVLLANVSDMVTHVDARNVVTYTNRHNELGAGGGVGADVLSLFPDEFQPLVRRKLFAARDAGDVRTFDVRVVGRTFHVRVVPLDGGELTLLASDETEVSDVLDRLGESEARAAAVLAAIPDLVFRMTGDGTFLAVHAPELTDLLVPADQIPGRKMRELLPPDAAQILEPIVARSVRDRTTEVANYELEIRGTRLSYEARIVPIGRDQVLAIVRNMTEYNERRERLALADRLASLGTMAAGVAHEINGPLAFVMLGLEWLEQHVEVRRGSEAEVKERLVAIQDGIARIQRIVRDLKGFTRKDDPEGTADVSVALDGALRFAAAELRYRGKIERDYAVVPKVRGSAVRLGQVFSNLIVNAAHALPEDTIEQNVVRLRTRIATDGRIEVEVSDSGRGIPAENLPHLFEPFFTTKAVGRGTGLGLWVCHEIVKELGGELSVESEVGKGSTFRVRLMRASDDDAAPPSAPRVATPPPRARILVIDDEPNMAKTLAILLNDHSVEVAIGGAAGLDRISADPEIDLVLCDLMMPEVTGMDVYAEVLARHPSLASRFAFMTGGAFTTRAREFLDTCNRPHLEKPFRADAVRALLRAEAERHARKREEG